MKIVSTEAYLEELNTTVHTEDADRELDDTVLEIIQDVRKNKDQAVLTYNEKFDGTSFTELQVTEKEFKIAKDSVESEFLIALEQASKNIFNFHQLQVEKTWIDFKKDGTALGQMITPLDKVGVYVPGGKAGYPSTVLMAVIPAQIAGVDEIVITTPPQKDGSINPYVLAAADMLGIAKVYKTGGAQAIAALAYGTETIPKVDKIVGPGNAYVARAKKWVFGDVAIDMIAGPSEICVLADESANAAFVAADLLSQAEHDENARAIAITTSMEKAEKIQAEVAKQTEQLERKEIIAASIKNNGRIVVTSNLKEAIDVANEIAAEHLELIVEKPFETLQSIKHAGAIFLGGYSSEPLGDYYAGPNHTLPTSGTARFSSPLGVYDYIKRSSIISYSKDAFYNAADHIITLANAEGLTAHANSIQIRKDMDNA